MQCLAFLFCPVPSHQIGHQPWCIKRGGGLKNNTYHLPCGIASNHLVFVGFVFATMRLVLVDIGEQIAVKLLKVVFVERYPSLAKPMRITSRASGIEYASTSGLSPTANAMRSSCPTWLRKRTSAHAWGIAESGCDGHAIHACATNQDIDAMPLRAAPCLVRKSRQHTCQPVFCPLFCTDTPAQPRYLQPMAWR